MESSVLVCQKVSQHLGLSEYEAAVYVSLVMEGASEARKLGLMSGVPRTKVYTTLKKLIERGLVFELPGEPRKYAPSSPSEAFEPYLLHSKEDASDRVVSLVESGRVVSLLEEAYKGKQSNVKPQREEVWIINGKFEVLDKIREALYQAEKSVVAVITEKDFVQFYQVVGRLLDKLVENGVNVWIGTPINSHNGILARELNYVYKVKHMDVGSPLLFLCVDNETFLFARLDSEKSVGVVCYSSALCNVFSLLFPRTR